MPKKWLPVLYNEKTYRQHVGKALGSSISKESYVKMLARNHFQVPVHCVIKMEHASILMVNCMKIALAGLLLSCFGAISYSVRTLLEMKGAFPHTKAICYPIRQLKMSENRHFS